MSDRVLLPAESLYWAVLTVEPGVLERGARPGSQVVRNTRELDELLAGYVPVEFEMVKAAYAVIDGGRVLAVAAPRELLAAACDSATIVAVPGGIVPEGVALPEGIAASLNLLWGDLEAVPVVRARRRATLTAAAVIVAVAGLALVGLERRTASLRSAAAGEWREVDAALAAQYRKPTREAGMTAMNTELSRLVRTRAPRLSTPGDAADALQRLLVAWPRPDGGEGKETAKVRTEVLSATADVLTLTVAVEERGQAERLSAALRAMPGWKLPQPQFAAAQVGGGDKAATGGTLNLRLAADVAKSQTPQAEGGR